MSHRTPRRGLAHLAALALVVLVASCGSSSDDDAGSAGSPGPTTTVAVDAGTGDDGDPGGASGDAGAADGSIDACALLDAGQLAELVAFEFGEGTWAAAEDPAPGTCSWTNDEQLTTLSIEVRQGVDDTLGGLDAGTGTELEDVEVGAATATGVRDTASDRLVSLYVPVGADSVLILVQSPLKVADDDLVAVAEAAGIAFENVGAAPSGGAGDAPAGDLDAVRFTVQSSDAGIDLELEVTAAAAVEAGNPVVVGIVCATGDDDGLLDGAYLVSAIDTTNEPGLVRASVEASEPVDGPGTVPGRFEATDSEGRAVEVDGQLTIDEGFRSGELVGADDAGNAVAVTWTCEPLG